MMEWFRLNPHWAPTLVALLMTELSPRAGIECRVQYRLMNIRVKE